MKINRKKIEKLVGLTVTDFVKIDNLSIYQCSYPDFDKVRVYVDLRDKDRRFIDSRLCKSYADVSKNFKNN